MAYNHNGITYTAIDYLPTLHVAIEECAAGRWSAESNPAICRAWALSTCKERPLQDMLAQMFYTAQIPTRAELLAASGAAASASSLTAFIRLNDQIARGTPLMERMREVVLYAGACMMDAGSNYHGDCIANAQTLAGIREADSRPYECHACDEVSSTADGMEHFNSSFERVLDPTIRLAIHICSSCLEDHYQFSEYQGRLIPNEDCVEVNGIEGPVSRSFAENNFYYDDDEGEWETRAPSREATLLNYSANPFDHFSWDTRNRDNALVFGVELEMEPRTRGDNQRSLASALGGSVSDSFILKSDGSLTDGVEMVTMPFTLAQHLDGTGVNWDKWMARVAGKAKSGKDTTHCGIHVHINKAALSALTIGKMLVCLNSSAMNELMTIIAQRGSGSYCQRDSNKKITDGVTTSGNRYDVMNVSTSHPTCEIRMFRGNLRPERIKKNIEFCHALVQYARTASMRDLEKPESMLRYFAENAGTYKHLCKFLADQDVEGMSQFKQQSNDKYKAVAVSDQ